MHILQIEKTHHTEFLQIEKSHIKKHAKKKRIRSFTLKKLTQSLLQYEALLDQPNRNFFVNDEQGLVIQFMGPQMIQQTNHKMKRLVSYRIKLPSIIF